MLINTVKKTLGITELSKLPSYISVFGYQLKLGDTNNE